MQKDLIPFQLKEINTNVFAIHMPQTERFKMEILLYNKDNTQHSDAIILNFSELKIGAIIPGFEDLKLFMLPLTTYQDIKEDEIITYIKDPMGNYRQIDECKIRTVNDVGFDSRYYYELNGNTRPIPTEPNSFIFQLFIAKNEEYLVYRDPQSKSIFKFLEQTFCFIVGLIETGHFEALSDFIVQHEKCFKPHGVIEKEQFIKFYKYLQKYVENKNMPSAPMKYETLFALTCMFGLFPDTESAIFSFKTTHNLEVLLKLHEKHIDKLNTLNLSSQTSETFIKGLAMIAVIEEYTQTSSNWISLLKLIAANQDLVNTIVSKFFDYAHKLKLNIRWQSFKDLQGIIIDMLVVYPNCLGLASSISDFIKLTKELVTTAIQEIKSPRTPSIMQENESVSVIDDELSLLKAITETISSNKDRRDCKEKILEIVKERVQYILQEYIENFPDLTKDIPLRTLADFMRELADDSDYLTLIFGLNNQLCENICQSIKQAVYYDEESLQALYEIIIKYYNEFLLFQINIPSLFKNILAPLMHQYRSSHFYLGFFSLCMVRAKLNFEEFNSILSSFLKNFDTSNKLVEHLDFLCSLFDKDDDVTLQKKTAVIYQIFSKMKPGHLGDNIEFVLQHVKNPKILEYYRPIATQEIKAKHLGYITTRNVNNPLLILQNLSRSFPKNSLINELITFSLAQVPSFNREAVLVSLFKEPASNTLLYMVLTEEIFKGSNVHKELNKICCSIIDDLKTSDIELKWIFFTYKLSTDIVIEQFNIIIEENKLTNKNSNEKLDIALLLKDYRKTWEEKIHKIDNLAEFISTFCPDASDAREYIDTLKRIWVNQHEKKLSDIISPAELDIFLPYIEKLKPFVKSASFLPFRQKAREGTKILSCKEEADKILKILNDFQDSLNALLSNPQTTLLEMSEFFSTVKDTKREIEILIGLVKADKKEYFTKILKYLKDVWNIKKICKGISTCLRIFNLTCKFDKLIEDGCKLSSEDTIAFFYEISKVIKELLGFKKNKPFYDIIQEFESGQELLEFTIARTNKSEIDFMVEAVNDYDESHISTQTIFDFMNFWTFITDLKTNSSDKPLELFLEDMKTLSQDKQFMDIVQNLKTSKKNFYGIQNIYLELNHKEEAKRKQIFKIIDQSTLRIIEKNKKFDIEIQCTIKISDKESVQNFKSSDIFELRDRAHLIVFTEQNKTRNKERQNYQKEELDKFKSFCSLADVIDQILKTLNKLNFNGYPELMKVQAEGCNTSIVDTEFYCYKNQFDSLQKFKQQLTDILDEWSSSVIDAYKKHYELTYLKGKDFWKVEQSLIAPVSEKSHKGRYLLDYIGKQSVKSELDTNKTPEQRLNAIGEALKNLPNKSKIQNALNLSGNFLFYITEVNEKATIKGLVSLYAKSVPASSQMLVCHNSTSWSELVAFSFRCFFDPHQKLFCLIRPERLSFSLQDQFLALMKDLSKQYPEQSFKLGFVTMNTSTHLVNSLKVKNQAKILKSFDLIEPQELKNLIKKQAKNCVVVTSSITGLGKTTWIKNQAAKHKLNCIKIPISGVVSPIEIGKRLLPILTQTKSAFWFTIGSIEDHDKSLLNEILFSLIVLRSFHNSKNVIKIPEDLHIYIELDSSCFGNLKEDIEIFNYLSNEHIEQMNWEDLDYLSPQIQFVCHYLNALADKSLGKVDLIEEKLVDKKLSQTSCIKLLMQRFLESQDKVFASYTQLTIFVDVLYSLFKSFSESGFFLYSILSRNSELNNPNKATPSYFERQNTPLAKFTRSLSSLYSTVAEGLLGSKFMPEEVIINMRLSLGEALILAASQFTSKSVQSVRTCQKESIGIAKEQLVSDNNEIIGKAIVSWDNFNPFVVVFTADQTPIFIYKELEHVPKPVKKSIMSQMDALGSANSQNEKSLVEYKNCNQIDLFERLVSLTNQFYLSNVCLKCFRKYNKTDQVCAFCRSKLLENNDNIKEFVREIAIESAKDYVLTLDNFIKMVLIFIRIQQKIPVIIMGETGCGKTSLIRYLCTRILGDEFRSFTIHAGITDKIILNEMNNYIKEAEGLKFEQKSIWIFFDEFNTSDSIGFIKEIICERTMLGRKLPENMVFLGACNPWRLKTQRIIFDENVGIKKKLFNRANKGYKLLYTVFPLPESMIDFVWDYGYLDSETEKKYVEAIFSSLEIEECGNLKRIMTQLVCAAHNKIKMWEDVSSVSLRDVSRYKILFNWLFNSLSERDRLRMSFSTSEKKSKTVLYQQAAVLALLHCYYLRISSRKKRSQLIKELEPFFMELPMTGRQVEKLLYDEEMEFLGRMEPLPGGIAKNQALRENVLALIVCIFTKTPIFICGKPGCSKSLAIQLVFDHLRGKDSNDPYFKTLPELIHVSYQGSEYCTSESILGVFTRAEKYLTVTTKDKEILPVIVFDEIGLAEISENNPLKILHHKLEIENTNKVSFVGISNWRLDASKMNRALYLARPDPDNEDLIFTAEAICKSMGENVNLDPVVISALATIYCNLRGYVSGQGKENVFGLRDYYFLIKGIIYDLNSESAKSSENAEEKLYYIIKKNIKRNFGCLENEGDFFWEQFCQYMSKSEKIMQIPEVQAHDLIFNNLKTKNTRYLMLITQDDCVTEYIEEIIRRQNENPKLEYPESMSVSDSLLAPSKENEKTQNIIKTLIGSQMIDDTKNESYGYKVLSDIILYLEKGYTLIMKKMDHLYSSLYDLFNQSFVWSGDKKYCRVALGALYNPKCLVHEDFHCIVFITEEEMKRADPPFLNRFEKYRLNIEDILTPSEQILHRELIRWVDSLTTCNGKYDLIRPNLVFVNYSAEYIFSLILKARSQIEENNEQYSEERVIEICKQEFIETATADFPVVISLNVEDQVTRQKLLDLYYNKKQRKFKDLCERVLSSTSQQKNVVYTYTQISDDIIYPDEKHIKELKLSSFRSEDELFGEIKQCTNSTHSLLVIRVEFSTENCHLPLLKHLLLNSINESKDTKELHFMIIIHIKRFDVSTRKVQIETLFQGWNSVMFDDLNLEYVIPNKYIEKPTFKELISLELIPSLEEVLEDAFDKSLARIRYNVPPEDQNKVNIRRKEIRENLRDKSSKLLTLIKTKLMETINRDKMVRGFDDWRRYILGNEWIKITAISLFEAVGLAVTKYYESYLMKILYILEKNCLLDSFFEAEATQDNDQYLFKLWESNFKKIDINMNERLDDQLISLDFTFGLCFPFSTYEYNRIKQIQLQAEDLVNQHEEALIGRVSFEKLTESSFFEEKFGEIYAQEDLFEKYFRDQLLLYTINNKITLNVDIASSVLERMFLKNKKDRFEYFLSKSKQFFLILGALEAILTLEKEDLNFYETLSTVYNMEKDSLDNIAVGDIPNNVLIFKGGLYYSLTKEQIMEFKAGNLSIETLSPDNDKYNHNPFLDYLFKNAIEKISSCSYILKFKSLKNVKSAFRLVEEKIIKSGVIPQNIEAFRPWIDLMQFIENCDQNPSQSFESLVIWLQGLEDEGIFSSSKALTQLINYLSEKTNFIGDQTENQTRFFKLQTQLYKNLVSYDSLRLDEALTLIDFDQQLWKTSVKIIDLLDYETNFSSAISQCDGNLNECEDDGLQKLKTIVSHVSPKIIQMLSNKAFSIIQDEWSNSYKNLLVEKFENFQNNLATLAEALEAESETDKKKDIFILGMIIWLKIYLYFYAIALENNEHDIEVLGDIDETLNEDAGQYFIEKIYVLKVLKLKNDKSLHELRRNFMHKNITWMKPLLKEDLKKSQVANVVSLLPLYTEQQRSLFKKVDDLMCQIYSLDHEKVPEFLELCKKSQDDYLLSMCIYSWFIKLYTKHLEKDFYINEIFFNLMKKHKEEITEHLGTLGCEFIFLLLKNFKQDSFFYLDGSLKEEEIKQRLAVLGIITSFIAQQFLESTISTIFFENKHFQANLSSHFTKRCLFGLSESSFLINNMKDVKENVEKRLKQNRIYSDAKYIYKCGSDCDYLFYFENCGRPNDRSLCPVCKREIGASLRSETLALRSSGPQQEIMSIDVGFAYIDKKISEFQESTKLGYLVNPPHDNAVLDTKLGLNALTFRFLHFVLHSALFGLFEAEVIDSNEICSILKFDSPIKAREYLMDHFLQDYDMLTKLLANTECNFWIFNKLLNFKKLFPYKSCLTDGIKLRDFEKIFEREVMVNEPITDLNHEYLQAYNGYANTQNEEDITVYLDETNVPTEKYPLLEAFNYIDFPTFEGFKQQFSIGIGNDKRYPLLKYFLDRHEALSNISALPAIVEFTNQLRKEFSYRISRDKATSTVLKDLLDKNSLLKEQFAQFESQWNRLHIQIVRVGCQEKMFKKISAEDSLSIFLPNIQKDESGILMVGTMTALADLQNELIYQVKKIGNPNQTLEDIIKEEKPSMSVIQMIKKDDVIDISMEKVLQVINENGYIHNYEYGKGKHIIYDFEEIEAKLYQFINKKKVLDTEKFLYMNYQFELYPESTSIITDIRKKIPQIPLHADKKALYKSSLKQMSNKDLIEYLGSLDYMFTYLCNVKEDANQTVEDFCKSPILVNVRLHENMREKPPLSKVQLKYIIDLYETVEEVVFDQALQFVIRSEFVQGIPDEERLKVIEMFEQATLKSPQAAVYPWLREPNVLVKVLKRLILRILTAQTNLENRLLDYFAREDIWSQEININDIYNIELNDEIKLKHAYVILRDLESQVNSINKKPVEQKSPLIDISEQNNPRLDRGLTMEKKASQPAKKTIIKAGRRPIL